MRNKNGFYAALAAPAMIWLLLLFIVPFYAVLAIAMGKLDRLYESPVAVWNPFAWSSSNVIDVYHDIIGSTSFAGPIVLRTILYVAIAAVACLLIGYPAAYFVARFSGRRKGVFLILLIAPFWISYMMRMLAWVDLLQTNGYANTVLGWVGISPVNWLGGRSVTVILGLVYGYIPFMILPIYASLDRIQESLLEAGRDLGGSGASTFWRVTLPLSRPAILAGIVIVTLPMFGDYYTNDLLGTTKTSMFGNLIAQQREASGGSTQAASLVLILSVIVLLPMLYYLRETKRQVEQA